MVSEDFLIIFYDSMGANIPGCGGGQFEPQGHGWQDLCSEPLCKCYKLNIEAVGFMVSEVYLKLFPILRQDMEANDLQGMANLDPRGMVGMVYVGDHHTLLYTKYTSCEPHGYRKD